MSRKRAQFLKGQKGTGKKYQNGKIPRGRSRLERKRRKEKRATAGKEKKKRMEVG